MIDPQVSMAFVLRSGPDAYSGLDGSGMSVDIGIPTSWQMELDLIYKVARILGHPPGVEASS